MGSEMCIRDRDIIEKLNLQARVKTVGDKLPETYEELLLDYSFCEDKIESFRKQSFDYLKKTLK